MHETIQFLVDLPQHVRDRMEAAENHTFSSTEPAPALAELPASLKTKGDRSVLVTIEKGSVETAALLCERGYRPALLSFAHGYNCGGGFEHAGGSQEEDIFRKTSLFLSLWPHRRSDDGPGVLRRGLWIGEFDEALTRKEPFYPHTDCGGIYSPHVSVVRDLISRRLVDAKSCESFQTFSVLTVAAQDVGFDPPFKHKLLVQKARTVLWMAASHGHDSVVLGAFGCGYFNNPPDAVAGAFEQLLGSGGEFENVFRVVAFGVIGGNRESFAKRFPVVTQGDLPSARRISDEHAVETDEVAAGSAAS